MSSVSQPVGASSEAGAQSSATSSTSFAEERALHEQLTDEIEASRDLDPEWFARYEDTDPYTCPRAELFALMKTAPSEAGRMFLFGLFSFRLEIAAITERGFN